MLDIRIDAYARWRGGELDRLLNARHSALHESVARFFVQRPAWANAPEVSFSIFGERGVIDILAFHAPTQSLLVIELKTAIVDVNDLVGGVDRKRRLGAQVAAERGWDASTVSCWVIVEHGRTNQRRLSAHRRMLRAAFPTPARRVKAWLSEPLGEISAISSWPDSTAGSATRLPRHRVRHPAPADAA